MATVVEERRRGSRARSRSAVIVSELVGRARESSSARAARNALGESAVAARRSRVWIVYAVLIAWMVGYVVSLMVRSADSNITWLDGWGVVAVDAVASAACLYRGFSRRLDRRPTLILGFALLAWAIGDALITIESLGGKSPSVPSAADAFYLVFYPLAYVATVELLQRGLGRLSRPNWLDGVVAGRRRRGAVRGVRLPPHRRPRGGRPWRRAVEPGLPDRRPPPAVASSSAARVLLAGRFERCRGSCSAAGSRSTSVGDTFNLFQSSRAARRASAPTSTPWPGRPRSCSCRCRSGSRRARADPLRARAHRRHGPARHRRRLAALGHPGRGHRPARHARSRSTSRSRRWSWSACAWRSRRGACGSSPRSATARPTPTSSPGWATAASSPTCSRPSSRTGADARGRSARLAFLFVDLNHFKEINDSFGHPAGDELLRQLGPRLVRAVGREPRHRSCASGGDEFGVVLVDADEDAATEVAERIVDRGREPFAPAPDQRQRRRQHRHRHVPRRRGRRVGADVVRRRRHVPREARQASPSSSSTRTSTGTRHQIRLVEELAEAVHDGGVRAALPAAARPAHRAGPAPSRRCCAGRTPSWAWSRRSSSCRWPRTPGSWSRSPRGCSTRPSPSARVARRRRGRRRLGERLDDQPARGRLHRPGRGAAGAPPPARRQAGHRDHRVGDHHGLRALPGGHRDACATSASWSRSTTSAPAFTSLAYLAAWRSASSSSTGTFITDLGVDGERARPGLVRATIDLGHEHGAARRRRGHRGRRHARPARASWAATCAQGYYISRPAPASKLSFQSTRESAPVGAD